MTTYPSVRPAVGADDRLTWSAPRRTTQARSLQTNTCALVSCQNSFAVLSNVRRSTSTLAQSSSMLRAPLPATSRPQSRLAAARQQHTARLHCAGRATGADRCRQPSTVREAVHGLLAVLLTLGKLVMRPSLADTMPTFTVIWFSDMMSIEFSLVPMMGGGDLRH